MWLRRALSRSGVIRSASSVTKSSRLSANMSEEKLDNGSSAKRQKMEDSSTASEDPDSPSKNGKKKADSHSDVPDPPVQESDVFKKFTFSKVLKADPARKLAFIHGKFDDGKDAVVILEKTAFELDKMDELFESKSRGIAAFHNDVYHNYQVYFDPKYNPTKTTLIYPATQQHLDKYARQDMHIIEETPEDYQNVTLPLLLKEKKFSTKWVDNILDHEKETDRIVFEDPDKETGFVLLPDLKWDGHNVESLYLVALVHKRGIHSIRELTAEHLPMLKKIKEEGTKAIMEKYGLPATRIRAFLHYQPTFYHLHIHFTNVQFDAPGRNAEKAHLLTSVISNLKNPNYYKEAVISFLIGEQDPLFQAFSTRQRNDV